MSKIAISPKAYDTIAEWKSHIPVATLMGEFSSGKSTLLNFILDQDVAATKVTATHMPPVWFTYSDTPFTTGLKWDGTEETVDLESGNTDLRDTFLIIRRGLKSNALKAADIIDAPGISDPGLNKDAIRFLTRYADFVVWCTAANQAWRQTEKVAYLKLSKSTQANSLLVITRMDKLRSVKDQDKVVKRVEATAGPLFKTVIPMQTPKAAAVPTKDRTDAPDGTWVQSGGFAFAEGFGDVCADLTRDPGKQSKPKAKKPAAKKPAVKSSKPTAKAAAQKKKTEAEPPVGVTFVPAMSRELENLSTIASKSQDCPKIVHLIASISKEIQAVSEDNTTLDECLRIDSDATDINRLVSQIGQEVSAFGRTDRIRLGG